MRKIIISIIFISINTTYLFSQNFTEITAFYQNGKPKDKTYKNEDLEIIKIERLDINGNILESYNYNPKTGNRNGEFTLGKFKGYFSEGLMSCENCEWSIDSSDDKAGTLLVGTFKNGRPIGQLKIFEVKEKTELMYDPLTSYLLSYNMRQRINYSSIVGTGYYTREYKVTLNYNNYGKLDGQQKINKYTILYFTNGRLDGFVIKNHENVNVTKDSIFRDAKIWKQENKFIKNVGFIKSLYWNEFISPWELDWEFCKGYGGEFFGSENSTGVLPTEFRLPNAYYSVVNEKKEPVLYTVGCYFINNNPLVINNGLKTNDKGNKHFKFDSDKNNDFYNYLNEAIIDKTALNLYEKSFYIYKSTHEYSETPDDIIEILQKKKIDNSNVNIPNEYTSLFNLICNSPILNIESCKYRVYKWDYANWLNSVINAGNIPITEIYYFDDKGKCINYLEKDWVSEAKEQIEKDKQKNESDSISSSDVDNSMPLTIVEQSPEFPGGGVEMMKYIQKNIQYPKIEKEGGVSGTCYVTFVVEKDGSISDVKVLRGVSDGPGCDKEAIRLVKSMPKWKAGKQNGREVRVQFNLPIKFSL